MSFLKETNNRVSMLWEHHPFGVILFLAILSRLLAVFFSRGFGWFDDHFLIIEASQSWVDGYDYNRWLPTTEGNNGPTGHNMFYTGLHYLLFRFLDYLNIAGPQGKMFVVRLLHAALSLLIVGFGYRISKLLSGAQAAKTAGLLLAVLWLFPFLSVRNLVEYTCIPFLLWGTLLLLQKGRRSEIMVGLLAGLVLGLAFAMRFQSLIYIGGIGLALLIQGRWKAGVATGLGVIITAFICLGTIDIYLWGFPFAELSEYIRYNMHSYGEYISGPWYQYVLVILGILVPPLSLFLFFGTFYSGLKHWKKSLLIFLPLIIFLLFHSYFPNKQERFILPLIPFLIILGQDGWNRFVTHSGFWTKHRGLLKASMSFFWVLNLALLLVISTTYSKRSRVESMTYLSRYENIKRILVENTNQYNVNLLPMYYLGQWVKINEVSKRIQANDINAGILKYRKNHPDFFIFEGSKDIQERVDALKQVFPDMTYETTISPGFIDKVLFWLNPINENQNAYIYRNDFLHPEKID